VGVYPAMKPSEPKFEREQLEKAIAAQEGLRGSLDDAILEVTIAALRKQLAELSPEPVAEQQRKQVTILFMDVVDSTRLLGALDPEENMAIMDAALQSLAAPVTMHGGKVTRFMGDGFLAVFGLPKARENDPEMAVRAGLEVLKTAQVIAQELETKHHIESFQVRIGVNTGLVVAGGVTEAEGTIMGSAVNLAARLEDAAPPDGLLISQQTYAQVRGLFDFHPGKSVRMKGFSEPVEVYQVKGAKPRAFRPETRGVEGVETAMIGREVELKALQDSVEAITTGKVDVSRWLGKLVWANLACSMSSITGWRYNAPQSSFLRGEPHSRLWIFHTPCCAIFLLLVSRSRKVTHYPS
jgi:class 3 adenylate cyclase